MGEEPTMINVPEVKMGVVAVSRDCFPVEISRRRQKEVLAECGKLGLQVVPCETIIESARLLCRRIW